MKHLIHGLTQTTLYIAVKFIIIHPTISNRRIIRLITNMIDIRPWLLFCGM